jgi:hypothetical protein
LEKVENIETESVSALRKRVLQRAKIGMAFAIGNRDLAVEHSGIARQVRKRPDQRLKPLGPIEALAGADDDAAAANRNDRPIPVVFYLVEPALARRRFIDKCRELRRDEGRETRGLFF